jgi:hypothetical protein
MHGSSTGSQLRFTDADGMRLTFATNTKDTAIAALELRHSQRARAEDRIRAARAIGLRNLPLHDTAQNQLWLEIVQIALGLLAWMPMLALTPQPAAGNPDGCGSGSSSPPPSSPAPDGAASSNLPGTGPGPLTS